MSVCYTPNTPVRRKVFDPEAQFNKMCRILTDQTQPMNSKVKLTWLEYFVELLPLVEAADFQDTSGG